MKMDKEIMLKVLKDRYNLIASRGKKSTGVLRKIERRIRILEKTK